MSVGEQSSGPEGMAVASGGAGESTVVLADPVRDAFIAGAVHLLAGAGVLVAGLASGRSGSYAAGFVARAALWCAIFTALDAWFSRARLRDLQAPPILARTERSAADRRRAEIELSYVLGFLVLIVGLQSP